MNHETPVIDRDTQRQIYDLLVNQNPHGLSRKGLVEAVSGGDRVVRDQIEAVKILAATVPHRRLGKQIIGFDPKYGVYAAAQDSEQAARIIDYVHSRVKAHIQVLEAQLDAYEERFDRPAPSARDVQGTIFGAKQLQGAA